MRFFIVAAQLALVGLFFATLYWIIIKNGIGKTIKGLAKFKVMRWKRKLLWSLLLLIFLSFAPKIFMIIPNALGPKFFEQQIEKENKPRQSSRPTWGGKVPYPIDDLIPNEWDKVVDLDPTKRESNLNFVVKAGDVITVGGGRCFTVNKHVASGSGDHNPMDECVPIFGHKKWPNKSAFPYYKFGLIPMQTGIKIGEKILPITGVTYTFTVKASWLKGKSSANTYAVVNDTDHIDNAGGPTGLPQLGLRKEKV